MKSERVIYAGANPQSQDQDQGSDAMKAEILKKTKEDKYIKEERKRKRFMDNNDGNPSHGGEPAMDAGDWRSQLQADSRQRIINKIMETLLNHIPFSGQEGMTEIKKIAARFEEKMYGAAKSQSDYLRKISLKILTWESKYKSTNTNSLQLNSAGSSGMQPQVTIQGQHLSENIQSNMSSAEVQNTDGLSSALPPTFVSGISSAQAPTPALNMSSLQSALPTLPGAYMPDSLSALPSPQGWQQAVPLQPQQQSENLQQRIYQEQLKQQLLQSHIPLLQQQQQEMLQKPPLLLSQQSHVQLASSAVPISLSRFQQHEQSAISNLTESMVQQAAIPQEQILFTHQQQGQLPSPHMPSMEHSQTQFAQVQSPMNQMNPQQQHLGSLTASLDSTAHTGHTNGADWEEEVCQKVSMDTNNWRPPPGGEPAMDTGDWRSQLQADSRQRIVNKIMDTLKRHLPFSGQEGLHELKKIAVRFEEKIYTAATSQSDYLRKISLKMLTMESKSQNTTGNSSLPSNSGGNSNRLPDPGSFGMEAEAPSQGQSLSMPVLANQSQARQQLLSQNIQNNRTPAGVQNSAGLSSALPPASGLTQNPIPSLVGQSANLQSMSGTSQNSLGNSIGQGVASNMFANTQRPMPGRQQVVPQISLQYMYQQQLQQQLVKSNFKPGNLQLMQNLMQQQQLQQNLLQQQNNMTGLQNMMNSLQPSSNADPRQGTALNSLQQFPVGSIQQNPLSAPPQANMNSFSSQNGINMLQNNINLLKPNSGIFPSQHLKQQEQQLYQNQLKQQYQQRQMQKHQIFQQQGLLQQLPGQMETQRHQINIVDDMNINAFSSSQGGSNMLQGSIDSLLSSSGVVYNQCQKQKQEEEVFQNQLKQPYVQVQMQKPQMLQEKQRRQIQQLQQQAKQQLHHIYFIYLIFLTILLGAYFFGTGY